MPVLRCTGWPAAAAGHSSCARKGRRRPAGPRRLGAAHLGRPAARLARAAAAVQLTRCPPGRCCETPGKPPRLTHLHMRQKVNACEHREWHCHRRRRAGRSNLRTHAHLQQPLRQPPSPRRSARPPLPSALVPLCPDQPPPRLHQRAAVIKRSLRTNAPACVTMQHPRTPCLRSQGLAPALHQAARW